MSQEFMSPAGSLPESARWTMFAAILCCVIFLYFEAFGSHHSPRNPSGDQAIYLQDAARMFDGQVVFRDFDHFTFPGTSVIYCALFRLFGVKAWVPQVMLIALGALTTWLGFEIGRRVLGGAAVLLPGFLFLALPFAGYFDATHHWFSTLAATTALVVLIERRTPERLALAGVLCGVATWFAQSMVLLPIGFGVYLVWEARLKPLSPVLTRFLPSNNRWIECVFRLEGWSETVLLGYGSLRCEVLSG
jgi:hypothetical protein